jgi:hypothetical protein
MPLVPADRGSTDDASTHLIPTAFDAVASGLFASNVEGIAVPVSCSNPLIEASVIESKQGTAIVLNNWSGGPVKNLVVTINIPVGKKAELASPGKLKTEVKGKQTFATLDLDVADGIIFR